MAIKCDQYDRVCVITPGDDFTAADAQAARKSVESAVERKKIVDFVVDFEKAGFIDSAGLETLLWMQRKAAGLSGQLKLANLDDNCRMILQITRLERRFDCHTTLAAALRMMR